MLRSRDVIAEENDKRSAIRLLEIDTVSAVSILCGITASEVFLEYARIENGAYYGQNYTPKDVPTQKIMDKYGFTLRMYDNKFGKITTSKFVDGHPKGKYMLIGNNFCVPLINGEVTTPSIRGFSYFWWWHIRSMHIYDVYIEKEGTEIPEGFVKGLSMLLDKPADEIIRELSRRMPEQWFHWISYASKSHYTYCGTLGEGYGIASFIDCIRYNPETDMLLINKDHDIYLVVKHGTILGGQDTPDELAIWPVQQAYFNGTFSTYPR